nr:retrovirus-related Pol polyprotein from transposon TNT 1-94 [Tanacetum cinerariifolium]
VLVTKPHNKTPYELLLGISPSIGFMRPFRCPITILNTLDPLGKFDKKADEGFLVRYSMNCKAFRVFNSKTKIVQETLHINFLENKHNVAGIGPKWLFDIDTLTMSINYQPVIVGNQPIDNAGIKENLDTGKVRKETVSAQQYVLLPLWFTGLQDPYNTDDDVSDDAFDVKEYKNDVMNKMLKAFPLPVMSFHCQKTFPLLVKKGSPCRGKEMPLLKKIALLMKTRVSRGQRHIYNSQRLVSVTQLF